MVRPWVSAQEWQQVYGERWREFRRWYFAHPWTLKRCIWCLAKPRPVTALQLNHLTYRMADPSWPALWQVVPMCKRCHDWETRLTNLLFGEGRKRTHAGSAHYWATFGVPGIAWGIVLLVLLAFALLVV